PTNDAWGASKHERPSRANHGGFAFGGVSPGRLPQWRVWVIVARVMRPSTRCSFRRIVATTLVVAAVGCSGRPVLEGPAPEFAPPPVPPAPAPTEPASRGTIYRDDVVAVIERGFPRFLQMVDVEAKLWDGKFVGWR